MTKSGGKTEVDPDMKESRRLKVRLKATSAHPFIAEGEIFEVHPTQEKTLKARKWAVDQKSKDTAVKDGARPDAHNEGKVLTGMKENIEVADADADASK